MLFHLDMPLVRGGFVGVEVFFVVSGYLISQILIREIDSGSFTVSRFYERRVRRIFPSLFWMLVVTNILAFFLLLPLPYRGFAQSTVAAAFSVSNLFFLKHTNYFDLEATTFPLLHTWSLGVEEQFYIIFPLFFLFIRRWLRLSWSITLIPVAIASFAFCVIETSTSPTTAFYLPISRCWEFLIGSVLAAKLLPDLGGKVASLCASSGLLMLTVSVFGFDRNTSFPGAAAMMPCLGTALIIYAGNVVQPQVNRLLATRPLVWIGKISYSLYLWHWPMIKFANILWGGYLSASVTTLLVAAIFACGWLSWRFVEQPVRFNRVLYTRRRLFSGSVFACLAFLLGGFLISHSLGLPSRFGPVASAYGAGAMDVNPKRDQCDAKTADAIQRGEACLIGSSSGAPSFAVVGDSFADSLVPGVSLAATEAGQRGLELTFAGCYPLLDVSSQKPECRDFIHASIRWITAHPAIRTVILIGRWTSAVEGTRIGAIYERDWFLEDATTISRGYAENQAVFLRSIKRTLAALKGRRIFIVDGIPEQAVNVPVRAAFDSRYGLPVNVAQPLHAVESRHLNVRRLLAQVRQSANFTILDVSSVLCDGQQCSGTRNGQSLYLDDEHLSKFGAEELSRTGFYKPVFE